MPTLTINNQISPRIITVNAPDTEITLQEIVDLLRQWEDSPVQMDDPRIINAAGKESLGGGVTVGITAEIQDGQLAFEARYTPIQSGTVTTGTVPLTDGTIQLIDSSATFQTNGVARGDMVFNYTDSSQASVIEVIDQNTLIAQQLLGGTDNDFDLNDSYEIYDVVQCNISGGNLVAVDGNGNEIDPVFPTFGTQVIRTASSSATTQSLATIERAAFEGGVWLDVVNGVAGTTGSVGTGGNPVNNLADFKTIAATQGFKEMFLRGNLTAASGDSLDGFTITGKSTDNTITLDPGALFTDCSYEDVAISGGLSGTTQMHDCDVGEIANFAGEMHNCKILVGFTVTTGATCFILDCKSGVQGASIPYCDTGGANTDIGFRGYDGGIEIRNMTSGNMSVDLNSGHCKVAATNTGGTIVVRGTGKLTNNTGGSSIQAEGLSGEDSKVIRATVESMRSTHQGYGRVYFVTPNGQSTNDGLTPDSALTTVAEAHAKCVDGANDVILFINPSAVGYTHNEDIVITKSNVHLRATSRDITFKPALLSTGGTVLTIGDGTGNNGYSCSVSGLLIDADKANGTTNANYCIQINGKFCLLDSVWAKQSILDCVRINGGDYHVIHNAEFEKADRHGLSTFDAVLPSGSPREISVTGRSNIYLNGGDGIHLGVSGTPTFGTTTRLVRVLSGDLSRNTGYGIHAEAEVDGLTLGDELLVYNNTAGDRNILTAAVEDRSYESLKFYQWMALRKK